MPFDPVLAYGILPDYDRLEFRETGFLTETVSFTPESEMKRKKKHEAGALGQDGQVQFWRGALTIEVKGGIVPNAQGRVHGLPANFIGGSVTSCAHFAASTGTEGDPDYVAALPRHGYTRNPDKLLAVTAAKTDLGDDAPNCTITMMYFPEVSNDAVLIA